MAPLGNVTIVDVANRAGVAISSVSAALNGRPGVSDSTRSRIRRVADEMGFVPSIRGRSLSAKKAFAIGLVIERPSEVLETDPFFAGFIGGIEAVLSGSGYALVLQMSSSEEETLTRYRQLAADRRVDAVLLSEILLDDPRIPVLHELGLPVVGVSSDGGYSFPSVVQPYREGVARLTNYLVGVGHCNIAYVAGPSTMMHARRREAAWRESIEANGMTPGPVVQGGFTYEGGAAAADTLLSLRPRPTAVACANDLMAIGFISRAQALGLTVPDDISVAGFDGIALGAYLRPPLTTLRTSPRELGTAAAELLLKTIDDAESADVIISGVELVLRGSTGSAPRVL